MQLDSLIEGAIMRSFGVLFWLLLACIFTCMRGAMAQDLRVLVLDALDGKPQANVEVEYFCTRPQHNSEHKKALTDNEGLAKIANPCSDQEIQSNLLWGYFDRHWVHFLAYAAVSILPLLAWQRRPALVLSLGVAGLSAMLEIIHGIVTDKSASLEGIVVNLLGVIAGALLGLNILALRSRTRPRERTLADG
jgi:hypothetical protein